MISIGGVKMSKVISLMPRLKTVAQQHSETQLQTEVLELESERKKMLFHERRQVKRTLLSEFVSAMVVLPEKGLLKVSLYDISEDGVAFEMDLMEGQFKVGEEILMRVYLNQKTYFPVPVVIKHVTPDQETGTCRHGTEYMKGQIHDVALQHFVKFIESAGEGLKKDNGDLLTHHRTS